MGTERDSEASRELVLTGMVVVGVLGVLALVIGTVWPGGLRQTVLVLGLTGVIVSVVGALTMLARAAHHRHEDYTPRAAARRNAS
jgi:membrane associated rhomboid family serine protease